MTSENLQSMTYKQAQGLPHNWIARTSPAKIKYFRYYAKVLNPDFLQEIDHAYNRDPAFRTYPINKKQFRAIPLEQIPDLDLEFLRAMDNIHVYWFSFDQLTHLTKEQLKKIILNRYLSSVTDMKKLFSIIYIAEQEGERGDKWLRGPMREAVVEYKTEVCKEDGEDLSDCPGDLWTSFPDFSEPKNIWATPEQLLEEKREEYLILPPDQSRPVPDRGKGHIYNCEKLRNSLPNNQRKTSQF